MIGILLERLKSMRSFAISTSAPSPFLFVYVFIHLNIEARLGYDFVEVLSYSFKVDYVQSPILQLYDISLTKFVAVSSSFTQKFRKDCLMLNLRLLKIVIKS